MLDWIFEGIVDWVSGVVTQLMDAVSGLFLSALGTDMLAMEEYFPFITKAFTVLQYAAWTLLALITVWQLFRALTGPLGGETENPWSLLLRGAVFATLIGFAKPIFLYALTIARAPYTALMDVELTGEDFTFSGVENVLKSGLATLISTASVVGTILIIILMIALGWNYFKLLLEVVERYVVVGILCYTSPLAYSMGASKSTAPVFKAWCRMVGSQLLLLVMNVWFLRGFHSSIGQYIGNGGALSNGQGSIFLWLFCAIAFLKTGQRFDAYLSSLGLNVAQTGSGLGVELMAAARMVSGIGGGFRSAGNVFRTAGTAAAGAGTRMQGSFASGFASRFKGNSFVRDSVVQGGVRMGAGGSVGFIGRMFGGMAARNGATLTGDSIASVAARPPESSGSIAGEIADRSLGNYFPNLKGQSLTGTEITGGRIHTNVVGADGGQTAVDLYSAAQYERPSGIHSVAEASDGSRWYQMASGPGAGAFYDVPAFTGSPAEATQVLSSFPDAPEGTLLRTVGAGELEATLPDGTAMWYNSAYFEEPDAPHRVMQSSGGVDWYAMQPYAVPPAFEPGDDAIDYNRAQFRTFMPGYETPIATVDGAGIPDGYFEVRHENGSGTRFYDAARYEAPHGSYRQYEDAEGNSWYGIQGEAAIERRPVYENGKPVYEGSSVKSVTVETVRYPSKPSRYRGPAARGKNESHPPQRRR